VLIAIVVGLTIFAINLYKSFNKKQRQNYLLIICLAFVPVLLLFILSMPPLKSSFVERYLIPSVVGFSLFGGVTLALGFAKLKNIWRVVAVGIITVCMLFGIINVYYYGNYNKNSAVRINTRQVIEGIAARAAPGEPIIASSPWVFYEAVFYDTVDHPVYFIDAQTQYIYNSLDMLKYNDMHKIKDLYAFVKQHPVVWYMGNSGDQPIGSPDPSWRTLQTFSIYDPIDNKDPYKAAQLQAN